jgi:hypothetical protein
MSVALTPSFTASAAIAKMRFAKISGDFTIAQCVANDVAFGVSSEGSSEAPIPGAGVNAAETGGLVRLYGQGESCPIEVGAAVVANGFVKPDANGRAIPCVANDKYSGQVLQGQATVGGRAMIFVCRGVA